MKIGIIGPFNPATVIGYLNEESRAAVRACNITATSVNVLVKSLIDSGQSIVVFTTDVESYDARILSGERITIHVIGMKFRFKAISYFPPLFLINCRLVKYLEDYIYNLDLIHAHWSYEFAHASSKFIHKVPVICTVRDWAPYIYKSISLYPLKLFLIQKVFWIQKIIMARKVLNNSKIHFISNSFYTRQRILSLHPNYNVPIIYNSIRDEYILKERKDYPQNPIFISVSPSIDDKRKNCYELIKAFSLVKNSYPNARLLMVGQIHYNRYLYKKWKRENLLKNVEFLGYLDHHSLVKLLDQVTCLVHPALEETFGNVLIEGMARRIPVVGGESSGAVPYVLKQGYCGCLCDVKSSESIAEAMIKIVEDNLYAQSIVNNATKILLAEYSSSVIAEKHILMYRSIIN